MRRLQDMMIFSKWSGDGESAGVASRLDYGESRNVELKISEAVKDYGWRVEEVASTKSSSTTVAAAKLGKWVELASSVGLTPVEFDESSTPSTLCPVDLNLKLEEDGWSQTPLVCKVSGEHTNMVTTTTHHITTATHNTQLNHLNIIRRSRFPSTWGLVMFGTTSPRRFETERGWLRRKRRMRMRM